MIIQTGSTGTTITGSAQVNVTTGWKPWPAAEQGYHAMIMYITGPAIAAQQTYYTCEPQWTSNSAPNYGMALTAGQHAVNAAYDGFTFSFTNSVSGTIRVYGIGNS